MKFFRPLLLLTVLILTVGGFLWWNQPQKVDMASYAPADSLVYLESNSITNVIKSIVETNAWNAIGKQLGTPPARYPNRWLSLAASMGLAPVESVVLSRAQVAVVLLDLNSFEDGSTLRIKPEGALMLETHTAHWRIKPYVEGRLQQFANSIYGPTTPKRYSEDADYLEWSAPAGDRQIVAAIDGSLVVIGNSKSAVQKCLQVRQGSRANLAADSELRRLRGDLGASNSLAFGYVSSTNTTKLFSWGAPLLFGKAPGDTRLEQLLANGAARVLKNVAWSTQVSQGVVEDRFLFSLEPSVVSKLQPAFDPASASQDFWKFVPDRIDSITMYRYKDPLAAWEALEIALASRLDALSAVLVGSVLKAALLPYGIENSREFLEAVGPEVVTLRLPEGGEGPLLIARIRNRARLHEMFMKGAVDQNKAIEQGKVFEVSGRKFQATFVDGYLILGSPEDVSRCLDAKSNGQPVAAASRRNTFALLSVPDSASVLTYANDSERIKSFFATIASLRTAPLAEAQKARLEDVVRDMPFAATETMLNHEGVERKTHSAFGQFSSFVALLQRERPDR